eukprot:scaffold11.g4030.t1
MSTPPPDTDGGAAFYAARLARARAVLPERRSACMRAFLAADALLSEAADVLPLAPGAAVHGSADKQLGAQIKFVQASTGALDGQPCPLLHQWTRTSKFHVVQVQGLIAVTPSNLPQQLVASESNPGGRLCDLESMPHLEQLLARGEPVADARLLGRLLVLSASLHQIALHDKYSVPFCCLELRRRGLAAAHRRGPAGAGAAEGWQLPTAEGLLALALAMQTLIYTVAVTEGRAGGPPFRNRTAWAIAAGCDLVRLRPSDPNGHFKLGRFYLYMPPTQWASRDEPAHHWLHALCLAQEQGNLALTALFGYEVALMACVSSPDAVASLVEEADAAMAACKALLPALWVEMMRSWRSVAHANQQEHGLAQQPTASAAASHRPPDPRTGPLPICLGCGQLRLGIQACSRCHQARFCSRECFVRSWPAHKAACNAAAWAAGAGDSSSSSQTKVPHT